MDRVRCMCGNVWHEATGHVFTRDPLVVLCGPCARNFCKWLSGHTKRKWGGCSFYEHAVTSIKPP